MSASRDPRMLTELRDAKQLDGADYNSQVHSQYQH